MARAAKLKVYCTAIGFYDALVAAPSQKAALKAWGTSTDLFGAGRATLVEDPDAQADALARPGEVIKRPRGDAKTLIAEMDAAEEAEQTRKPSPAKPKSKPKLDAPPPPDRSALDAAEGELREATSRLQEALDAIAARRSALDDEEARLRAEQGPRIAALEADRDEVKAAYERAVKRSRAR